MAKHHVKEQFSVPLTHITELVQGQKDRPVTGLVVAVTAYDELDMHLALMLEEGTVVILKVQQQLWNDSWKSQVKHGKVINVKADVIVSFAGCFCLSTTSVPEVKAESYTFKRNEWPEGNVSNTAIFTDIVSVLHSSNPESPTVLVCRNAKKDCEYHVQTTYDPEVALEFLSYKAGMVIHMGPVSFTSTTETSPNGDTKTTNTCRSSFATVIQIISEPGLIMANLHVREPFSVSLTEFSDLALGERNLPITGLVVAVDSYDADHKHLAVMLEEGGVINVKVNEKLWTTSWRSEVKIGKVIEFEGDVLNSFAGSFVLTTKSVPTVLPESYNFKRNDVPDCTVLNTAFFVEIISVLKKKADAKENAPLVVSCRSASSEILYMKAFGGLPYLRAEAFKPGMVVHMGPVKFNITTATAPNGDTKTFYNIHTSYATVFQVVTGVINTGKPNPIDFLCELAEFKTGDKISFTGTILRNIVEGATYVVDRPGTLDFEVSRPPRVGLVKIPTTHTFVAGDVVKGVAIVYTYDAIRLECVSLEPFGKDGLHEKDALLEFKKYKPMIIEAATPAASQGNPSTPSEANKSFDEYSTPSNAKKTKYTYT